MYTCPICGAPMKGDQCKNCGYIDEDAYEYEKTTTKRVVRTKQLYSPKSRLVTSLLAYFFGIFGAHYFYLGKPLKGVAYLFTLGGLGIGYVIDIFRSVFGGMKDSDGLPVKSWMGDDGGAVVEEVVESVRTPKQEQTYRNVCVRNYFNERHHVFDEKTNVTIPEDQLGVFVNNGRIIGELTPGSYTIYLDETAKRGIDYRRPFVLDEAIGTELYLIDDSKTCKSKFTIEDQLINDGDHKDHFDITGNFSYKIADKNKFIKNIMYKHDLTSSYDITEFLKEMVEKAVVSAMENIGVLDSHVLEDPSVLNAELKDQITILFEPYGVEVQLVKVKDVILSEDAVTEKKETKKQAEKKDEPVDLLADLTDEEVKKLLFVNNQNKNQEMNG